MPLKYATVRASPSSNPTFGSGGFGRGTVWNGGIGDILGELGRAARTGAGRPPRRGGGGFRTGGEVTLGEEQVNDGMDRGQARGIRLTADLGESRRVLAQPATRARESLVDVGRFEFVTAT